MKQRPFKVIQAAAVRDAAGVNARPGAVVVEGGKVVAAGHPDALPAELLAQAEVVDRQGGLVLPAMVNAHTHLELTAIGPQPYDAAAGFVGWVKQVRSHIQAAQTREGSVGDWLVGSAKRGAAMSIDAGVQAVGDIGQNEAVGEVRRSAGLSGQTYLELFGLGPPFDLPALRMIAESKFGLQPHAPYSAGRSVYQAATLADRPLSTHLAETREEHAFTGQCTGPLLDYVKSIERWDDAFAKDYGSERSPVLWMMRHLDEFEHEGGWLLAHCNYVSELDIQVLADTNASVAYCPIASEYFGHSNHRYREMLAAGVNVCLGTDSIVCANPDDPQPLGVFSAMRRLHERDRIEPATLLAMATINGARGLWLSSLAATLQPGADARLACVAIDPGDPRDPLLQAMSSHAPVEPLWFTDPDTNTE